MTRRRAALALLCGLLGCLCFGAGDWLMLYGAAEPVVGLFWLTRGAAQIPAWRNGLAMALAFPGILGYGAALFSLGDFIHSKSGRRLYDGLLALGLTPWLCLHLFYVMLLFLFSWLNGQGEAELAVAAVEALYGHLGWLVWVSEMWMVLPFLCWFVLQATGRTVFSRWLAGTNVLVIYAVLSAVTTLLPSGAFRLAWTNGLMSESMALWFLLVFGCGMRHTIGAHRRCRRKKAVR